MTSSRITHIALAAIVAWCLTLVLVPAASAQTILRVDIDSTATNPDGSTWEDAFKYLQDALGAAAAQASPTNPIQIWVAEGTYLPTQADVATLPSVGDDREHTFNLIPHVEIYGGFDGTEGPLEFDLRDPATNITILSGDLDDDDQFSASYNQAGELAGLTFTNYDDNSYHVVTAKSPDMGIAQFPPSGAACDTGDCDDRVNGGAYAACVPQGSYWCDCEDGCWDFGNCCPDICTSGCRPGRCDQIIDSLFTVLDGFTIRGGSAPSAAAGGGVLLVNSSPRIRQCIIEQNRSIGNSLADTGGGVYVEFEGWPAVEHVLRIEHCTIRHNSAYSSGGGVHVANFELCGDIGETPFADYRDLQRTAIIDCDVTENVASVFGGGVYASAHSMVDVINTSIMRNLLSTPRQEAQFETDGAGLYCQSCAIRMWNCVVAQNINNAVIDERSSGLSIDGPYDAEILNCTIADNKVR